MSERDGAPPAGRPAAPAGWGIGHLRGALVTLGVLAVIGVPLAWWLRDGRAGLWVLVGLAIVAAFFSVSTLAVAWAGRIDDQLTLPVALGTYLIKVVLLGVLLVTARDASWVDGVALAWSVLVGTVAWVGVQVRRVWTSRLYYVDP
jgi:hypothetical protein